MIEIYRRYNPNRPPSAPDNNNSSSPHVQKQQIFRETAPPKTGNTQPDRAVVQKNARPSVSKQPDSKPFRSQPSSKPKSTAQQSPHSSAPKQSQRGFSLNNAIRGFLPPSLYNRETKKVLGFFTAEDLLLIALILLFSENEENDDPFTVLALVYILLSDYIDLPDFLI